MSLLVVCNCNLLFLDSLSFPYWLNLIRSSLTTRFNWFLSGYFIESILIPYSVSLFILRSSFLCLHLDYGERNYQPYSREYDWLGPDLTRNTWGLYILILPGALITLTLILLMTGPKLVSYYLPSVCSLTKYVYYCTFSASVRHKYSLLGNIGVSLVDWDHHNSFNRCTYRGPLFSR